MQAYGIFITVPAGSGNDKILDKPIPQFINPQPIIPELSRDKPIDEAKARWWAELKG